ncbi:translocation/assembly module TamB domain-containing protein [Faucicola boevrei]|uniref:translocation/assembly module TamB domain-containing protein n=1 Tax=Faucicola boevrei TaxID=346665 RepID=UPI0003670609|nr:translocation/assembly module TamB domain-containing protein [Moraxella boevrei]
MTDRNAPKPDDTEIVDDLQPNQDPAERDALWLRYWYPLSFVSKLAIFVVAGLLTLLLTIYYALGTPWGTQFLLNVVVQQTGIGLKVGDGNLRDGLWLYDIHISPKKQSQKADANQIEVNVDKAFVKVGWRALLTKEVHLREANVGKVIITNHKAPSTENKPFQYERITLPVNLTLDDVKVDLVRYQQHTQEHRTDFLNIDFKQADIQDFTWFDSLINVKSAKLGYNELLTIDKLSGKIDLQNDYPMDANATVTIHALTKAHFDKIDGQLSGSLKSLTAKVQSRYNHSAILGTIIAQPLVDKAPFDAKLTWKDALLPYASEQGIHLKNGELIAKGVTDDIDIVLNTELTAKDMPNGHYQGRANTDGNRLNINELIATLPEGQLVSRGVIDWENRLNISLMNTANGFAIRKLLPTTIAPYAPTSLNGKLAVVYDVATDSEPMSVRANLRQQDGEVVNAVVRQANGDNTPYHITANWQNLVRHNVPDIGEIDSPSGGAKVVYQGTSNTQKTDKLQVTANANIAKLNIAPTGNYQVNLDKVGEKITFNHLDYQGVAGQLTGKGALNLATNRQPMTWQIDAKAQDFNANRVIDSVPFSGLTGTVMANGSLQKLANNTTRHNIKISDVNMLGDMLASNSLTNSQQKSIISKKRLNLTGTGNTVVDVKSDAKGTQLQHFTAKFDGGLDMPNVPKGKFQLDIAGNAKQLSVNKFIHQGDTGGIDATGKLDLTQGIGWQVNAKLQNFDASYFAPNLPSQLTGSLDSDGFWRDTAQLVNIRNMNIKGSLKNQNLTATGTLLAKLNLPKNLEKLQQIFNKSVQNQSVNSVRQVVGSLKADNLLVQWGNNKITATGNEQQLVTSVDISTLNQLVPQLQGMVRGGIVLHQPQQQALPNVMVDLFGRNVSVPNFRVLDASMKGNLVNLAHSPSQLKLTATGLNIANQPLRALQLQFDGTQAQHRLDVKTESVRGNVQATLKGGMDLQKHTWQGVLGNGQIGTKYAKLQQVQPTQMRLNWQNPQVELASHCWQMAGQKGRLCFNDNLSASKQQGKFNLSVKDIDSQIFAVILPNDIAWSGRLNGSALINWQKNRQPNVNASFYSDNGTLGTAPQSADEVATTLAYQRISVIARSTADGLKLRADLKTANNAGDGYFDAVINPYQAQKPIDGTLVFQQVNLAVLKPFFPAFERLTGTGLVAGKVNGTLTQPKFVGDIEIQDASLAVTGLPMRMDKINVLGSVNGNQAMLDGDFITAGDGKGNITGTVDWVGELQAQLKLQGENLQISQPPLVTAKVNPMFDVIVRPNRRYVKVVGVVDIPEATIRPPEASEDVVTKSADVNVIDRRLAGQIDEVLRVTTPWAIDADIGVDLGKDVEFQGFGAKLPLAGALHLTQRGQGSLQARGVVQVAKRSKVEVFGQNLDLNFAQIRFNGAVSNPMLNMQATKEIQGTQVGVKVTNNVSKPNIVVFNNGGLTEQQAMNALVTGSLNNNSGQNTSEQDFRARVNNTLAAAGLSFGLSTTRGLTNEIGRAFGLQSLTLDASGTGSDTLVSITGYITPDLLIRYGVGVFTAQPELSMRYQLTRRLYIEGKSAVNNAVDLIYSWRY